MPKIQLYTQKCIRQMFKCSMHVSNRKVIYKGDIDQKSMPKNIPTHIGPGSSPEGGQSGVGERPTLDAPHRPPQPAQRAGSWGWESVRPRTPHTGPGSPPRGRAVGAGRAPDPGRPKAPPPGTPYRHPHNPKPRRGEPGLDRPPPSTPDGARDRGRTRGGARTTWNGPTSAQCRDHARCARHTTQGGGERTPRERERTHKKEARGDYQKGNRTERAEHTDRVEWRTSERG